MRYYYEIGGFDRYKQAQQTYLKSNRLRRFTFHFTMWGILFIGIILTLVFLATGAFQGADSSLSVILCCGLIGAGVATPLLRPWQLRRMHSLFNSNKNGRAYLEIQGPLLILGIEDRSESRLQRASVCKIVEDDDIILLFLAKKRFVYLSKISLTTEAIDDLQAWLSLPGAPTSC